MGVKYKIEIFAAGRWCSYIKHSKTTVKEVEFFYSFSCYSCSYIKHSKTTVKVSLDIEGSPSPKIFKTRSAAEIVLAKLHQNYQGRVVELQEDV